MAAIEQAHDLETFHATVCPDPANLSPAVRANVFVPTEQEIFNLMTLIHSTAYQAAPAVDVRKASAYKMALNRGLIHRNGWKWRNGCKIERFGLTVKGLRYLHWLRRRLYTPVIDPSHFDRPDLRQYERRPRSWARWCAALVEAERHSAADALYREHVAHVQDTRPMG